MLTKFLTTAVAVAIAATTFEAIHTTVAAAAAPAPAAACASTGTAGITGPGGSRVDVLGPLAQVLPKRHQDGASAASLCQARNGFESIQLEVTAPAGRAISSVTATTSALTGPGTAIPAGNVRLYREDYTTIRTLTDGELADVLPRDANGTCQGDCRFPDALIPDTDVVYHEKRAAFPFAVPAGENRAIWADIQVPVGQQPGAYQGSIVVTVDGTAVTVPVSLRVLPATLPSTSTLRGAFFATLGGRLDAAGYQALAVLGLNNRLTVTPNAPQGNLDATFRTFLQGTDTRTLLPGAAFTDVAVDSQWGGGNAAAYANYLRSIGQFGKAFAYCDEVTVATCASAYANNGAKAAGVPLVPIDNANNGWPAPNAARPDLTVPAALADSTRGLITIANYLPNYQTALNAWRSASAGRQLWAYTSCMSGGCQGPGDPAYTPETYWNGWASYGIDQVASEQRAMGWQAFATGVDGELYYDSTSDWDIWNQPFNYGLNGDGSLFYPYVAAKVGGTHSVPIESIRLRRIRDGRQDYELLKLAAAQGATARSQALAIAQQLFPSWQQAAVTPATFDAARARLVDLIAGPSTTDPVASHDLDGNGHPDVLAVDAGSGDLLFYGRGADDWLPNVPAHVGTGFMTAGRPTYAHLLLPGDVDGDGRPDLVTVGSTGALQLRRGTGTGSFGAPTALSPKAKNPVAVGDFSGDGRPDLLDQRPNGTVWLLAGNGAGFAAPVRVAQHWPAGQLIGVGDVDGDGKVDVIGRAQDGTVVLHAGNGASGWKTGPAGVPTGTVLPLADNPTLLGIGDVDGDGRGDLVSIAADAQMYLRPGNGAGGFGAPVRIGGGWWPVSIPQIAP